MQVKKIMTKNPACCTSDSTLQEVAHMMEMYDCGCIPVVESHQTMRPIGTITDRDITVRTFGADKNPLEMKASDIMTTDIVTVKPDSSVRDCMNVMENKQIRRVLVVDDNGRCAGIVAQADLAEHAENPSQTGNFVREVSESDSTHERGFNDNRHFENERPYDSDRRYESDRARFSDRGYDSDRFQFNERRIPRQENYSFSQNESLNKSYPIRHKSHGKKESFFSGRMLLTLLGSLSLGAGLRYYLGPETENKHGSFTGSKIKTYNLTDSQSLADSKIQDVSTHTTKTSGQTATPALSSTSTRTEKSETISGSVNSFDKAGEVGKMKTANDSDRSGSSK